MKKIILTTVILLLSFLHLKAQQVPTITTGKIIGIACKGEAISVPFTTTGIFDAGNSFKVQIKGSNIYPQKWIDLVTEGTTSPLKATIPLNYYTEDYSTASEQSIRVVATKPNIVGQESFFSAVYTKPNITLSGASVLNVNPYASTVLKFTGIGTIPIKVVFKDSTKMSINYLIQGGETNDSYNNTVYPTKSTNYQIAYTENICGRGNGSGNVNVTINEIGLKVLEPNVTKICVGNTLKVSYSATDKINTDNKFKINLKNDANEIYEIDAVAKDNIIEAIIPEKVRQGTYYYSLQIVSSSPKASSIWYDFKILIAEKGNVEIAKENIDVIWGNKVDLTFTTKGLGPWTIKMNDGSNISLTGLSYSLPNSLLKQNSQVKPEQSQNYSIASFTSGCGSGVGGQNITSVTVKPGVVLDSIQQFKEICVGQTISAKFRLNSSSLNPNSFKAVLSDLNAHKAILPATFENGLLKLIIPETFFDIKKVNLTYRLGISFNNDQNIVYSPNTIQIKNKPTATLIRTEPIEIQESEIVYLPVRATGNGIMTFVFNDSINCEDRSYPGYGTTGDIPVIDINVIKNTSFKLTSVSNSCGTTYINENKKIDVIIKNPKKNDVTIKYVNNQICAGDKIKVLIDTLGKFQDNNEFKVLLYTGGSDSRNFTVIGTAKGNSIEAIIPNNLVGSTDLYYIQAVSTNPVLSSYKRYVMINAKPNATILTYPTLPNNEAILLSGEPINTYLDVQNASVYDRTYSNYGYSFSDGTIEYGRNKYFYPTFTKSNTYSLLSISNECGNGTSNNNIKIKIVPFKIIPSRNTLLEFPPPLAVCSGANLTYPYSISGNAEIGTTYNLQIASIRDSIFTDLVSQTIENPINVKIPTQIKEGDYFIRLISNTKEQQSSPWIKYKINTTNDISITTDTGFDTLSIIGGDEMKLQHNYIGILPTNIVLGDNTGKIYSYNSKSLEYGTIFKFIPQKTSTFSLKSVENACGYGKVSGSVKVTVIPALVIQQNSGSDFCTGKEVEIGYSPVGEFESGNSFKFSFVNNLNPSIKYELGQTNVASGKIKFKIPDDAQAGIYQLVVNSSRPSLTRKYSNYNIYNLPEISISGNTIINSGSSAYVKLVNKSLKASSKLISDACSFTLSDGTKGNIYNIENLFLVNPTQTTTYTLTTASNICGIGKVSGNVTITVNPNNNKIINTEIYVSSGFPKICSGASYSLYFNANGSFSSNNKFTAQLSDKNGENFTDIKTEGNSNPLKVTVPDDFPDGENYRFRVVSSEKDASSAANSYPLNLIKSPTVSIIDSLIYINNDKPITLKINLTGTPPWSFRFGTEQSPIQYTNVDASPYSVSIIPKSTTSYKIFNLNDAYCSGKVLGTGIVKIELVTANEDPRDLNITLFPNPTPDLVTIRSDYYKNTKLKIVDALGKDILEQDLVKSETVLDISSFTTGLYFLQFNRDNKRVVYKIQKL